VIGDCARAPRAAQWLDAAKAIMTTDTFPKIATRTAKIDGVEVTINGMAKGAGMIAPDMATMLSFVFTDAPIAAAALQALLSKGVKPSFNAVTVDGDTSTSDTLMLFATGTAAKRGCPAITEVGDKRLSGFKRALNALLLDLAILVAKDGEGARKFVAVTVRARSRPARPGAIAFSIANSPLVKTAIAGEDANWGRVVMAVGKAGRTGRARQAVDLLRSAPRRPSRRARSGLFGRGGLRLHEGRADRHHRLARHGPQPRHGLHLRSDQGLCRDQRRLSLVRAEPAAGRPRPGSSQASGGLFAGLGVELPVHQADGGEPCRRWSWRPAAGGVAAVVRWR
jgi:hypothetical protein